MNLFKFYTCKIKHEFLTWILYSEHINSLVVAWNKQANYLC